MGPTPPTRGPSSAQQSPRLQCPVPTAHRRPANSSARDTEALRLLKGCIEMTQNRAEIARALRSSGAWDAVSFDRPDYYDIFALRCAAAGAPAGTGAGAPHDAEASDGSSDALAASTVPGAAARR